MCRQALAPTQQRGQVGVGSPLDVVVDYTPRDLVELIEDDVPLRPPQRFLRVGHQFPFPIETTPLRVGSAGQPVGGLARAWSRSSMMSSMGPTPMDSRIVSGRIPAFASSSSDSWRCVVEAGWMARILASPRLSSRLMRLSASKNARPAS